MEAAPGTGLEIAQMHVQYDSNNKQLLHVHNITVKEEGNAVLMNECTLDFKTLTMLRYNTRNGSRILFDATNLTSPRALQTCDAKTGLELFQLIIACLQTYQQDAFRDATVTKTFTIGGITMRLPPCCFAMFCGDAKQSPLDACVVINAACMTSAHHHRSCACMNQPHGEVINMQFGERSYFDMHGNPEVILDLMAGIATTAESNKLNIKMTVETTSGATKDVVFTHINHI